MKRFYSALAIMAMLFVASQASAATLPACSGGTVNLRFDDGPRPETAHILDVLKYYNLKATFFVIGANVQAYPDIAKRIIAEGHQIANHSMNHFDMTTLSAPQIDVEISQAQAIIKQVTGKTPTIFAAPYTSVNPLLEQRVKAAGLALAYYTSDTFDWMYDADHIGDGMDMAWLATIELQDGDILEFHDFAPSTPYSLWYVYMYLSGGFNVQSATGSVFVQTPMCTGKLTWTPQNRVIRDWLGMFYNVKAIPLTTAETPMPK